MSACKEFRLIYDCIPTDSIRQAILINKISCFYRQFLPQNVLTFEIFCVKGYWLFLISKLVLISVGHISLAVLIQTIKTVFKIVRISSSCSESGGLISSENCHNYAVGSEAAANVPLWHSGCTSMF